MRFNKKRITLACIGLVSVSAFATDGYFSAGYGTKANGMGGAALTATDNAFAGANNPATAAWAGNRVEMGGQIFMPNRSLTRSGDANGSNGSITSRDTSFLIPEFGYNSQMNDKYSWGLSVYANGGMNVNYPFGNPIGQFNAGTPAALKASLSQLIIAPTFAAKLDDKSSVGVTPLIVVQQFSASGLASFKGWSNSASNVTDNGTSTSTGLGIRLGYFRKLSDQLNIGVSYSPRTHMRNFSAYQGLLANGGNMDIPENYGLGMSYQLTSTVSLAADYQHISYSAIPSIGNPSANALTNGLGPSNGAGFGWSDVNVLKLGVEWASSPNLILRAGYNHSTNPVHAADVTFNYLAPAVITQHYTFGGTYALDKKSEISFFYMYAPSNSVSGSSFFNSLTQNQGGTSGATDSVKMSQQALGLQYAWKF
jgi:long-chain fatty acid transport protein